MIYEFKCDCGFTREISCKMSAYDNMKVLQICCGKRMEPVIYGGLSAFLRDPFPKGYEISEHCTDEPVFCKDKSQLKDLCEAGGTVSRYLEDDM